MDAEKMFRRLSDLFRERAERVRPGHGYDGEEAEWLAETARANALRDAAEIIAGWTDELEAEAKKEDEEFERKERLPPTDAPPEFVTVANTAPEPNR